MKKWIREKKSIIIYFSFYAILIVLLIVIFLTVILSWIKDVEEKKVATKNVYSNVEKIIKEWITLSEFKKLSNSWNNNKFVIEILKNIDNNFYTENLVNSKYPTYSEFIKEKRKELNSVDYKEKLYLQSKKISKILPTYSEGFSLKEELTDYKFINHIESLIESFNLTTSDSIGISKVHLLDEFTMSNKKWDNLSSNIYSILLSLELTWSKSWIIDFLYFVENVWNITIKEDDIYINKNYWYLYKNWVRKVLEWDRYTPWKYNIFEHQIMDVSKISINDYIDNRYASFRKGSDFKNFIVEKQWNDEFTVKVDLNFYIKWQPTYKIKSFISLNLDKHLKATKFINTLMKNPKLTNGNRISLSKENNTLKSLSKSVANIRKKLQKWDNLDVIYKESSNIEKIIFPIFKKSKYIESVSSNYVRVKNRLDTLLSGEKLSKLDTQALEWQFKNLELLNNELEKLKKNIEAKTKVNNSYKRVIEIDFLIDDINTSLNK